MHTVTELLENEIVVSRLVKALEYLEDCIAAQQSKEERYEQDCSELRTNEQGQRG